MGFFTTSKPDLLLGCPKLQFGRSDQSQNSVQKSINSLLCCVLECSKQINKVLFHACCQSSVRKKINWPLRQVWRLRTASKKNRQISHKNRLAKCDYGWTLVCHWFILISWHVMSFFVLWVLDTAWLQLFRGNPEVQTCSCVGKLPLTDDWQQPCKVKTLLGW